MVEEPLRRLRLSAHTFGTTAALLHGVEELGLREILSEEMSVEERADMSPARRLIMILGARYEHPASKLRTVTRWYTAPGYSDETISIYLANRLRRVNDEPEEEGIDVLAMELDKAMEYVLEDKVRDAKSIIGLTLASDHAPG